MGYEGLLPSSPLVVNEEDDKCKRLTITTDRDGNEEEEEFEFDPQQAKNNNDNYDLDSSIAAQSTRRVTIARGDIIPHQEEPPAPSNNTKAIQLQLLTAYLIKRLKIKHYLMQRNYTKILTMPTCLEKRGTRTRPHHQILLIMQKG